MSKYNRKGKKGRYISPLSFLFSSLPYPPILSFQVKIKVYLEETENYVIKETTLSTSQGTQKIKYTCEHCEIDTSDSLVCNNLLSLLSSLFL